jgi:uncharacterized protein
MRWLAWLALIGLVMIALQKKKAALRKRKETQHAHIDPNRNSDPTPRSTTKSTESMLCCDHCHVYFPSSEAVFRGERVYCSTSHADSI